MEDTHAMDLGDFSEPLGFYGKSAGDHALPAMGIVRSGNEDGYATHPVERQDFIADHWDIMPGLP